MFHNILIAVFMATPVWADGVVPTRTIRAAAIIQETDVILRADMKNSGYARLIDVVGQETRVVLYPGKPIGIDDIGPPAIVHRNQLVRISFSATGLQIVTEGRALERGAIGDLVRIMNLSSRATVFGQVQPDGSVKVSQ
ncbi:flagellar basal body P-ring formation protein FlgA [Sulfitobacter sp. M57]|uniref:flagellar basal body P-ring formation chaperone FlgA n=1 Tax=unclassified Sulfitobacter TaxID=196795 RepID=UPI0023E34C2D|nr:MULTISPECIES: flagellar basal body P-ring formation chaperone FlgA [unclassified Sulfitobacter]MDF3415204.1 flagellar basal body P-ring formation protein FlgA [Sulfitobacter sp. KE5]MDF3422685.1 flagellar basal body P-ring formation protein FlgA [Sulfitobacter sp. KE43]MDF3433750.1 flagellar basal body P-ring formation protein FlgA [Sulfitobacter sp. KE42]MDF3459390.1 flagellar basal body P-ring formation protein FlgA [Sulfitobacter sp. S74]MDF3463289.1 flagellar basal body P-ring formation